MKEFVLDRGEAMHERLGTAGFVLSIIALCLALTGGAFAASKALTKSQVKKIAKEEAKKYANSNPGAPGAAGANGKDGAPGQNGQAGAPGVDGKSVTGIAIPVGNAGCTSQAGGVKYSLDGTDTPICNGKEGSPWTAGGTLPPGKTLTGIIGMAFSDYYDNPGKPGHTQPYPISFPIPLAESADVTFVRVNSDEESAPGCPGRGGGPFPEPGDTDPYIPGIPEADPGFLCLYENGSVEVGKSTTTAPAYIAGEWTFKVGQVTPVGALFDVTCPPGGLECQFRASWAVTAPEV